MTTLSFFDPNLGELALSPENGIVVERFDPGFPTVRENRYDEPNADGTFDQTVYFGERVISMDLKVVNRPTVSTSRETILRAIRQFIHPRQRTVLRVRWEPEGDLYEIALRTSDGNMPIDSWSYRTVNLVFKTQPYFLSPVIAGAAEDASESVSSSLTFPFTFPFDFGGVGVTSYIDINNLGDAPLWPAFQIVGPISNPVIKNVTTGQQLRFENLNLTTGQRLDIDMRRATVLLGTDNYSALIDYSLSEWFSCDIGLNQISLEGQDATASTVLYAYWQIPYL